MKNLLAEARVKFTCLQLVLRHISPMKLCSILLVTIVGTMVGMALSTKGNEVDNGFEMEEQVISAREEIVSVILIPPMSRTIL